MPHFKCKYCGEYVPSDPGYELTAVDRHARAAGHPNRGLTMAADAPPRPRRSASPARQKWERLPLSVRGAVFFAVLLGAVTLSVALADAVDDDEPRWRSPRYCQLEHRYC